MSQGSSKDSGTNSGTSGFHDNRETADCTPDTGTGVHHSTTLKPLYFWHCDQKSILINRGVLMLLAWHDN